MKAIKPSPMIVFGVQHVVMPLSPCGEGRAVGGI